jgi:hypothetical protein
MDYGSELELVTNNNFLSWPTQYGDKQHTMRRRAFGSDAPIITISEGKQKTVKSSGSGPRLPSNHYTMIFPQNIQLVARFSHPVIP